MNIQVNIKKQDQITNQASFLTMEEAQAWYDSHVGTGIFGEHEVEFLDITAKLEQEKINAEALVFLASTDWMVVRAMERGEELSPEFKAQRQEARDRIVK